MAWPDKLLFAILAFIALSLIVPLLLLQPTIVNMSWIEKLLFLVLAFQAMAFIAWLTMLRREMKEEKEKKKKLH
jgi:predicted tellurium resistance membrane protein TerC